VIFRPAHHRAGAKQDAARARPCARRDGTRERAPTEAHPALRNHRIANEAVAFD
jgi:hypothetical protein